jgi:hypothetical protein
MRQPRTRRRAPRGVAFLVTLIFVSIFACLAVGVAATAQSNLVVARNRLNSEQSLAMAEGGLCLMLRNLGGLDVSGAADAAAMRQKIGLSLKTSLANSSMLNATNITWDVGGVHVPTAILSRGDGSSGQVDLLLQPAGGATAGTITTVTAIGRYGGAARTITYHLRVDQGQWNLPPYGITSKGLVKMTGNARVSGANTPSEGTILSATTSVKKAVQLTGNVNVSGDVVVCNSAGKISKSGNVSIGGQQIIGAPEPEWPAVNISPFTAIANNVRSSGASGNITLSNIRIPPNTNPTFSGNTTLNGVIYIQSPNKVSFSGNVTLTGLIVCDTPTTPNLANNSLQFTGNLQTYGVESLPAGSQYDALRTQTGSFLLAPGFDVSFTGNSTVVNGCMVANQFTFTGNSGGRVKGGIVCLADNPITMTGNSPLIIDRSGVPDHPAGLTGGAPQLVCVRGSYAQ